MKFTTIITTLIIVSNLTTAQIITGGESGSDKVDPSKIEKWITPQKSGYQGAYHFGFSEGESNFYLFVTEDSCYAQITDGYWTKTNGKEDWIKRYEPVKNVRLEGSKFYSDKTNGEFVIYNHDNKKTKGLIVYKPWRQSNNEGISEFGFYSSPIEPWFSGKYPYTSYRLLSEGELLKMNQQDLKIMRNEIYARYYYIFTPNGEMDKYFRTLKWYAAKNKSIDSFMTGLEKRNIDLIQKIEKNNDGL